MCGRIAAAFLGLLVKSEWRDEKKGRGLVEAASFPIALHPFFNG
jgi:hypothetical protein